VCACVFGYVCVCVFVFVHELIKTDASGPFYGFTMSGVLRSFLLGLFECMGEASCVCVCVCVCMCVYEWLKTDASGSFSYFVF